MSDELWIGPSESESETSMFQLNKQGAFTNEALTAPNAFCQFYTRRSLNDTSVHSALAEQLCSPLTDDKSPENRMGPVCFETFSWNQTVTFHHMWAKPEALACFLHGHNAQQTLSQRGWHAESPSRQETADDEGLGLGRAGERSRLGRGAYQRPDAQGEKSPMLGRRRKLHAVWWIQECQFRSSQLMIWMRFTGREYGEHAVFQQLIRSRSRRGCLDRRHRRSRTSALEDRCITYVHTEYN